MRTITFYSYKGGTGRSLVLANMAFLAATLGRKVVALDFDLEAPGLPYKGFCDERPHAEGLVGWLRDAAGGELPSSFEDYIVDIPLPEPMRDGGWLKLMPAGRAPSPNYFQDLHKLRLDDQLDLGPGLDNLLALQDRIREDLGADLLLIDARTGITSTNGVTTRVLADAVVALMLDQPEQLDGSRAVLRALQPLTSLRTSEPIDLFPMLSRVPPRSASASPYELTEVDREQLDRVRAFLNEPTQPLTNTLDVPALYPLHTDPALTRAEFVSFKRPGSAPLSALHVDYWRLGIALFGAEIEDAAVQVMAAESDPDRLLRLSEFFAAPDMATRARGMASGGPDEPDRPDIGLEERVEVLRRQAAADPSRRPDLAALLLEVSSRWADLGRWPDALAATIEAVDLYRALAVADPATFDEWLAGSLNNLAVCLGDLGRPADALPAIEEAVALRRTLADANPDRYLPDLASSLNNLAVRLGDLGRPADALPAIEEAVALRRALADANPDRYLPDLASSLNNLAVLLGDLGRPADALPAIEEAVALYRSVADANPDRFLPDLASALNTLANRLSDLGRHTDALPAIEEAVTLRRALADTNPDRYLPDLVGSLNNLAHTLRNLGDAERAAATREAIDEINRRLLGTGGSDEQGIDTASGPGRT